MRAVRLELGFGLGFSLVMCMLEGRLGVRICVLGG